MRPAPCDQPLGVWDVVLLVFLGLLIVWFIIGIMGLWVAHGWATIAHTAARRRRGFWRRVFLIDGVKGCYAGMDPGHAATMLVRCWDPTGAYRDHVDPDDTELYGLLAGLADGGVAALTVFMPGWALDVTALQVTRASIGLTGSESGAPIVTLNMFRPVEPVFGVQARGTGRFPIRRRRFLNATGTRKYDREHAIEVRARPWEWENVALPVDLAVPSSLMLRMVREGLRNLGARHGRCWSDGWRRYGRPVPRVQYRSPTPRFDQWHRNTGIPPRCPVNGRFNDFVKRSLYKTPSTLLCHPRLSGLDLLRLDYRLEFLVFVSSQGVVS